ncbi:MAG: SCP2 sterol-binding domain-containing protein [Lachnospiraceae bacterium]
MKINIYYGGRGIMNDPTLYVIDKMQEVLEELNVGVQRFNLYEQKNSIPTLPQTLKDADGIILATTVEWYGIGGFMQQFLDACWLYGDKEKIAKIYMCPIVMATTYGEREGKLNLATAWEILGGLPCSGICGYITDPMQLESNKEYITIIEKKAENMYRTINQKLSSFPASNQAVKQMVSSTQNIVMTPQESEQLSKYVSDDKYVQTQKSDILELTSLYKEMMEESKTTPEEFLEMFKKHFSPVAGERASYSIFVEGKPEAIYLSVNGPAITAVYEKNPEADVELRMSKDIFQDIIGGRISFQRAFMAGSVKVKGDFKLLRMMDQFFVFGEK